MLATEKNDVVAFWGPRKESLERCAERALQCLRKLAPCDKAFAHDWRYCGKSLHEALANKVDLTFEALCKRLDSAGRSYNDFGELIDRLGFNLGRLWNGEQGEEAAHVRFECGAYSVLAALPAPNRCSVHFPESQRFIERLVKDGVLRKSIEAVVTSYEPDFVQVTNVAMIDAIYPAKYRGHRAGWATYLSDRYGALPELPTRYEVTRINGLGNLIVIAGVDWLTASNELHVEAVKKLSEILQRAGMLDFLPPR